MSKINNLGIACTLISMCLSAATVVFWLVWFLSALMDTPLSVWLPLVTTVLAFLFALAGWMIDDGV
jgi:hypothetical protein